jgi:AraC-like DNA-binding protein
MEPQLPVSHAIHLVPFFRFLDELGAPVQHGVAQSKLPGRVVESPDCYAPTESVWAFIGKMARSQDIPDLGLRVGYEGGLRMMGAGLTGELERARSLLHGLQNFSSVIQRESSEMACWLTEDRDEVRFHLHKTFEPGVLGYRQTEWLGLVAMLTAIQFFAGPDWQPTRISIRSKCPAPELASELFGNTELLTGQAEIYIAFPRSMLALAHASHGTDPRFDRPKPAAIGLGDQVPAADFANRLRQCLKPYLFDGYPDVRLAADLVDTSPRTLQRRLRELGTNYRAVVDGARLDLATRMLTRTDATAAEIGNVVGYSDPSHFARAFRRFTGMSPGEYRLAQDLHAEC